MRRREFVTLIGGTTVAATFSAHAQQAGVPVVALIRDGSADTAARYVAAFPQRPQRNRLCRRPERKRRVPLAGRPVRSPARAISRSGSPTSDRHRDARPGAVLGLQIQVLKASTIGEIDAAFANIARERPDALFVAGDAFFLDRRVQFATLTARCRIPASYSVREAVAAGGLMSYGPDLAEVFRQIGVYTASIPKGAKPADLPVLSQPNSSILSI